MNIRRQIFWLFDKCKGSPLGKTYQYTHNILESKDRVWAETQNKKQLKKLLNHALLTTSFYKDKDYQKLQDFPVINKNLILDNYDGFFSKKNNKANCKLVHTSGSTGVPFRLHHNKNKVNKINVDNIYFSSKSGYTIGEPMVFIRAWIYKINYWEKFNYFKKNVIAFSTFDLVDDGVAKVINKLNERKALNFITYASALETICRYLDTLDNNPIRFKTKSIVAISDALSDYTKTAAFKYFGVVPLSRYSNTESGIIAQQISDRDNRFRINDSSFVVEVLDLNKDVTVPYGSLGRIVITDLYNFALPLIRYDTGDIGAIKLDDNGIAYFTEISGRKVDQLFSTDGKLLPSLYMAIIAKNFGEIKQYQLVQKSKIEYHVNLNTDKPFDPIKLIKEYKKHLGDDAIVKVNFVNVIPLLSSGKRRQVVNEYYS